MDIVVVTCVCVHIVFVSMIEYLRKIQSYTFHSFLALNSTHVKFQINFDQYFCLDAYNHIPEFVD